DLEVTRRRSRRTSRDKCREGISSPLRSDVAARSCVDRRDPARASGDARATPSTCRLLEFQPPRCEDDHPQQKETVPPALDLRRAIPAFAVADRQIGNLQIELCRAEQQVEVSERIEIAEVCAVGRYQLVVGAPQHFRAAERVLDALTEEPRECEAEEL